MSPRQAPEEILVGERDFDSVFSYTAGTIRSRFLTEIRDNKRIVGTKCPHCNMVWVPARSTCVRCFESLNDFEEVSDTGEVVTFSVVHRSQPFYPTRPPFAYGVIKLEGADSSLVHLIGGIDPANIETGMKVKAVFRENRIGSILDIEYFEPLNGSR